MRTLLNLKNLSINTQNGLLLESLNLSVVQSQRIGLIGPNGSGKSTLLKAIVGQNRNCTVSFVQQIPDESNNSQNLYEYLSRFSEEWWQITNTYEQIFKSYLNIDIKLQDLSGGELMKIHLAKCFSENSELNLLDEPTNHLDSESIEHLKTFILNSDKAFIISSHDVDFLDAVIDTIWAIEDKKIKTHSGGYTKYLNKRDSEIEKKKRLYKLETKKIEKLQKAMKERETQAKLTHINVARDPYIKKKAGRKAHVAKVLKSKIEKRIEEKLDTLKNIPQKPVYISLKSEPSNENLLVSLKDLTLEINDQILISSVNLKIYNKDRILISGKNGSGKSTLLTHIYKIASERLSTIFLDQKYELINKNMSVWDNVLRINKDRGYEELRKILGNFLFRTDDEINKNAQVLSGGELTRLALAMITVKRAELLILDEPTNNLDINSIESMITALNNFSGAMIVVSHNKNFVSRIGINQRMEIRNRRLETRKDF